MLQVFLCHANEDNDTAIRFREYFEKYIGFSCFVAPQKINPSEDFIYKIKWHLRKSRLVIPLISRSFLTSSFANQEIGFAIAHERDIVPISIDGTHPKGMINNLQDTTLKATNENEIIGSIAKIYTTAIEVPDLWICRDDAKEGLTNALCKSNHFAKTAIIIPLILKTDKISKFNKSLLDQVYEASKTNHEIYNYFYFNKLKAFLISKGYNFD